MSPPGQEFVSDHFQYVDFSLCLHFSCRQPSPHSSLHEIGLTWAIVTEGKEGRIVDIFAT